MTGDQLDLWGGAHDSSLHAGLAEAVRPAPDDADTRRRIVSEVDRSCLVEASAGTGKTRLLVDRVLRLVEAGARLENVVAITFTEKAASELRSRVRDGIQRAWRDENRPEDERRKFGEALTSLDRATISTIHSFCTTILKARPVEAGVSPGFTMAAKVESLVLKDEAWEIWKERELSRVDSPLRSVMEVGGALHNLKVLGDVLVENRDLMAGPGAKDLLEGPLPEWRSAFEAYREALSDDAFREIETLLGDCLNTGDDKLWGPLRARLPAARRAAARVRSDDPRAPFLAFRPAPFVGLTRFGKREFWKGTSLTRLRQVVDGLNDACERYLAARRSLATVEAVRALRGYLEAYEELKSERGFLDFQDLLIRTRDLLRDHPDVRADLMSQISHLLVDEFQDTDPLQAEIAFLLSGDDTGRPGDWHGVRVRPGRLFLVGDPKQSIYRFRRADIQVYEKARDILVASGGDVHAITVNFRTRPGIAAWVNRVFERLMPAGSSGGFRPAYSPLVAYRGEDPEAGPAVERLPLPAGSSNPRANAEKEDQRRRFEAGALAAFVRSRVEEGTWRVSRRVSGGPETAGPAGYGDVALLFRALTGLEIYEDAFREAGVPYRIEGGKYYFQRREVQSLISVLRAIDSPNDREGLIAALRSPLLGFDDETILIAAAEKRLGYGFRSRPSNAALAEVFDWLRDWHERRHVVGPWAIVAEVLDRTKALAFFALQRQGEQRVANLMKIADEARRYGGEPGAYRAFLEHLVQREASVDEGESQVLEEDEGGYVHFITVHKAKGLEFPVVIVADLLAGTDSQSEMLHDRPTDRAAFRLKALGDGPGRTPAWDDLEPLDEEQQAAEEIRLFYVAATRARDRLILPLPEKGAAEKRCFYNLLLPTEWPPNVPGMEAGTVPGSVAAPAHVPLPADLVETEESRALDDLRRAFRDSRTALLSNLPPAPRVLSPSGLKLAAEAASADDHPRRFQPELSFRQSSRALALGRLVHEVLQRVDRDGSDAERWIDRLLPHHPPLGDADRDDLRRLVRTAVTHPVWERARRAPRVHREAPFLLAFDETVLVDGTVDLLIEEEDGLTVVDWKTDRAAKGGADALFARYRGQALGYALGVTRSAGRPVRNVVFLFLDSGESRNLEVNAAVLDEAESLFLVGGAALS